MVTLTQKDVLMHLEELQKDLYENRDSLDRKAFIVSEKGFSFSNSFESITFSDSAKGKQPIIRYFVNETAREAMEDWEKDEGYDWNRHLYDEINNAMLKYRDNFSDEMKAEITSDVMERRTDDKNSSIREVIRNCEKFEWKMRAAYTKDEPWDDEMLDKINKVLCEAEQKAKATLLGKNVKPVFHNH